MQKHLTISMTIMVSIISTLSYAIDSDNDGIADANDNCWYVINPDQTDSDNDCPSQPFTSDPNCGNACDFYCRYMLIGDVDYDCDFDLVDFSLMAGNWLVDCFTFPEHPDCICIPVIEICDNGVDDDCDGLVDTEDPDCIIPCDPIDEICNNGLDDDCDGLVDTEDPDCQ